MRFHSWRRGNDKLMEADILFCHDDLAPALDERVEHSRFYIGS